MPRTQTSSTMSTYDNASATGSDSIMIVTGSKDNSVINNIFEAIATSSIHIEAIQTRLNHKAVNTIPCDSTNQYIHAKTIENRSDIGKLYTHTTYNMGHDSILLKAKDMYTTDDSASAALKMNEYVNYGGKKDFAVIIPAQHTQWIDFQIPARTSLGYYDKTTYGSEGINPIWNISGATFSSLKNIQLSVDSVLEQWGQAPTSVIVYPFKSDQFATIIPASPGANLLSGNHTDRHFRLRIKNQSPDNSHVYFKSVRIPLRLDL